MSPEYRAVLKPAGVRYMAQYILVPHTELYGSLQVSSAWHRITQYDTQSRTEACTCQIYGTVYPSATHRAVRQSAGVKCMAQNNTIRHTKPY